MDGRTSTMAKPDGTPWPFYIVLRADDTRLYRHPTLHGATLEAERLAQKEGKPFKILRVVRKVAPLAPAVVIEDVPPYPTADDWPALHPTTNARYYGVPVAPPR
jgi:hypothetical protein